MDQLDTLISIRALLSNVSGKSGEVTGSVIIDRRVSDLVDELAETDFEIRQGGALKTPQDLKIGQQAKITFRGAALNYYERFDDFIKHFPSAPPNTRFHIHDIGFTSDAADAPAPYTQYLDAVRLWKILVSAADHVDGRKIFLLSSDKLEIDCAYTSGDLRMLEKLARLESELGANASSREEKRTLLKRALLEDLGKRPVIERFAALIANFAGIYDRYWQNFRLYLEGIDFNEIFQGYVEKHSKLIGELNGVLGAIQTAIIGLPIASFVILEKMAAADHPTFKNTLLLLGCVAFVAFLAVLSLSQGRTLDASKSLASELDEEIARKSPDLAAKLKPAMSRLSRHVRWVTALLWTVRVLIAGLFVASVLTYSYVTWPIARDRLDALVARVQRTDPALAVLQTNFDRSKSQIDLNQASAALVKYWDGRLGKIEQQIERELTGDELAAFRKTESAWRALRTTQVEFDAAKSKGGSIQAFPASESYRAMTEKRTTELETYFEKAFARH